jgi:hypothetical protein
MKKLLLGILVLLSLNSFSQNKWIYVDTHVSGPNMKFILYQKQPDLSYLNIRTGTSTGNFKFDSLSAGIYRLNVSMSYAKYLPTWHPLKALWDDAGDIDLSVADTFIAGSGMLANPALFGPGMIKGKLLQGFFKAPGDPLKNINVIIVDNSNQFVTMALTTDSGTFSVSNLPVGTYKIKTDVVNATNTNPKTVVLDSTHLTSTVNLTVNKNGSNYTAIKNISSEKLKVAVYPNPSTGIINICAPQAFRFEIINMLGQTIKSSMVNDVSTQVDMNSFQNGIYFVNVNFGKTSITQKLLINH